MKHYFCQNPSLNLIRKDLSTSVPVVNTKYKTQYAGVWKEER
jgi:hypothetical protein